MSARKPPAEVLTLAEAAIYLRTSPRSVQRLAAAGKLPSYRLPGMVTQYVRLDDLRAFIAKLVHEQMAKTPIDPATNEPVDLRRIA